MVAAALIDRLVHHATMVTLKGKSYRLRETRHQPRLRRPTQRRLKTGSPVELGVKETQQPPCEQGFAAEVFVGGCAERGDAPPPSAQAAGCLKVSGSRGGRRCASRTAFNRLLRLPGASVIDVSFGARGGDRDGRGCGAGGGCARAAGRPAGAADPRPARQALAASGSRRQPVRDRVQSCAGCAAATAACTSRRCRGPGATRTTPATSRTPSPGWRSRWPRRRSPGCCGSRWDTVGQIVERVVAEHLDERRLHGLVAIGVRRDQLPPRPALPDHGRRPPLRARSCGARRAATPRPCRRSSTCSASARHSIRAVSIDMSGGYEKAIREHIPDAEICFDPFHVVRLAQRAVDQVRRDEWNAHERSHTAEGNWIKGTRWSLLKSPDKQTIDQLALLAEVQHANKPLYRAFLLKEELRAALPARATPRSRPRTSTPGSPGPPARRLEPFVKLARTIRRHRDGILAAIRLGLTNGRLEGLNSRIRLISHRSFGFHSAAPLIALIYLCCTGIIIPLPDDLHPQTNRSA